MADDTATSHSIAPTDYETLPWHSDAWQRLTKARARLPHALLLQGQEGLGKRVFALRFARMLLCADAADEGACGRCKSCHLLGAGNHPDLMRIGVEEERSAITVDQIRAITDFLSLKPHTAAHKVVIVAPADLMNLNAANALLKLLEEPPASGVFLLVSSRPMRLPATVRSRCVPILFRPPPAAMAQAWLTARLGRQDDMVLIQAGGAPYMAEQLAGSEMKSTYAEVTRDLEALANTEGDPIRSAARWKTLGTRVCLEAARSYISDRVRRLATTENGETNSKYFKELLSFFNVLNYAHSQTGASIDETLLLEETLVRWSELHAKAIYTKR